MKQNGIKILISILFIIVALISVITINNEKVTNDEKKFKAEYEQYNGEKNTASGKEYPTVSIELQNGVKYIDDKEVIKILQKKTGVIYFGFPQCPWCRSMIETLLEARKETKLENIYYYNALKIRDERVLKDDQIQIVTKGTKSYYKILDLLGDKANTYEGLNDESIKRLYFPTVVFVKDGKVIATHMSTVSSQEDPYQKLTKKQKQELKKIYINDIKKIQSIVCSSNTAC